MARSVPRAGAFSTIFQKIAGARNESCAAMPCVQVGQRTNASPLDIVQLHPAATVRQAHEVQPAGRNWQLNGVPRQYCWSVHVTSPQVYVRPL